MGVPGLGTRAGGPNEKGYLLLASIGAAILGTLLLSIPLTVLTMLALMPQEQRGQVADPSGPGGQLQQQLGLHHLPEESRSDLRPIPPAAHLIGVPKQCHGLCWESENEEAFLQSGTQFLGDEGLALPQDGVYFLYCHIGYRGRAPSAGEQPRSHHHAGGSGVSIILSSWLYRAGGAYGSGEPELLLQGADTVNPPVQQARGVGKGTLWYASVGFGGLAQLRGGERIYVNVSHPGMVDFRRGKTFFGAVMVG
ncbi:lymphotoxin-beta [Monodelphis domestica]|uniref:Lymphotoxin-beta n=1 Tax=Monodelphis domestica TaxID=13616 RepID=F6Z4T6_MONDO|nr:lymphotoxin-beta [Monodelphis domestica]